MYAARQPMRICHPMLNVLPSFIVKACFRFRRFALRRVWFHLGQGTAALFWVLVPIAQAQDIFPSSRGTQRAIYQQALEALARNDAVDFSSLRTELADYPLLPYLEYAQLTVDLDTVADTDVQRFLDAYPGTVLARRVQREWQETLARQQQWQRLIQVHDPFNTSVDVHCKVLEMRLREGDTSALDAVDELWNVGKSQPNVCDPLFETWRAAGRLTPQLGWQRFEKVMEAGDITFARYLSTLMPERENQLATLWLDTVQRPERLGSTGDYVGDSPELNAILRDTLRRLARGDAEQAWTLADFYAEARGFTADERIALQRYVLLRMLLQNGVERAEELLRDNPTLAADSLIEVLLRDALKRQDWDRFDTWLPWLSEAGRASERWRYWQARSVERSDPAQANALYVEVAGTRSFYGFLAADLLGIDYAIIDRPVVATDDELRALLQAPALSRAVELFLVGDERAAQAEWQFALATLSEREVMIAARLAERLGWHRNGIQALIQVSYWDDLQLRFPLGYRETLDTVSTRNEELDLTFLYAIARQESAFITDARSSAGAMGLMQLMPGTARDAAREMNLPLTGTPDLFDPNVNLTLGSHYLAKMLRSFDGNRILAAAAYNAGPARVRRWLDDESMKGLPLDIWIETLPFGETRGYVQNVLSYSVIYGYRLGRETPLLNPVEAAMVL